MAKYPFIKTIKTPGLIVLSLFLLASCGETTNSSTSKGDSQGGGSVVSTSSTSSTNSETSSLSNTFYQVAFVNYDQTLLYQTKTREGETAIYAGDTPTRPQDDQHTYSFNGWNKSLSNIRSDSTFVAQYASAVRGYTVSFLNYDKTLLDVETVLYGDKAIYCGDVPEKPSNQTTSFSFSGWDKSLDNITGDSTFVAQFSEKTIKYTVTFKNYDGTVLKEAQTEYGGSVSFDLADPTRPDEGRNHYTFNGWDANLAVVSKDIVATARYKISPRAATKGLQYSFDSSTQTYSVTGYNGTDASVYIPLTYADGNNGTHAVTRISSLYGTNSQNIQILFMDDNITELSGSPFFNCSNLTSIRLSDNLVTIGSNCFQSCYRCFELALPASVKTIGTQAFNGLPKTVKFSVDEKNSYFVFEKGILFDKKKTKIVAWISADAEVTIPESVTEIADYAFNNASIASVTLPSSITKIGNDAFSNCNNLKTVVFNDCPATVGNNAFQYDWMIRSINLGSKLVSLGDNALSNTNLTAVSLPSSVTSISSSAFSNIYSLKSITVASGNPNYCSINDVLFSGDQKTLLFCPRQKTGTLTIPKPCQTLNASLNENGNSFTDIIVESGNTSFTSVNHVLMDYQKTIVYMAPSNLTSFTCPDTTTTINKQAFMNIYQLLSVTLDAALLQIGDSAFSSCNNLSKCALNEGLTTLGSNAFNQTGLTSVVLPNSLTKAGDNAFSNCSSLTSLTFGSGLTTVPGSFAYWCHNLTTLALNKKITQISYNAFSGSFITSLVLPEELLQIDSGAFSSCQNLKTISGGAKVTSINYGAFSGCTTLSVISLSSTLTTLGGQVFSGCTSLSSIVLPSSLVSVDNSAFDNVANLKTIFYLGSNQGTNAWIANLSNKTPRFCYYTETANYDGYHWRYVSGVPTIWVKTP